MSTTTFLDSKLDVREIVSLSGLLCVASQVLPSRAPRFLHVPLGLNSAVRAHLQASFPNGLYSHQANAINCVIDGADIVLATSTASGKSLVFMAYAAHLAKKAGKRTFAVYPVKALIRDQRYKWETFCEKLALKVSHIDGDVPGEQRAEQIAKSDVVLMTPDVMHAWLMANLSNRNVSAALRSLGLLVLDEAHVYDGAFGTNMAFLLRRFQAIAPAFQMICSTATLGRPGDFIRQLTGRSCQIFGPDDDGSGAPPRSVIVCRNSSGKAFDNVIAVLKELTKLRASRFIAFVDSRKAAEQIVSVFNRGRAGEDDGGEAAHDHYRDQINRHEVLPYRAGYEPEDGNEIQLALQVGSLSGVVSTSALELGLDIGEVDTSVLLDVPPTLKSFWQRLGRAGRRRSGRCLIIDTKGLIQDEKALEEYLARPIEPSWLYLENRYLQYANALCAAIELQSAGIAKIPPFSPEFPRNSRTCSTMSSIRERAFPPTSMLSSSARKQGRSMSSPYGVWD